MEHPQGNDKHTCIQQGPEPQVSGPQPDASSEHVSPAAKLNSTTKAVPAEGSRDDLPLKLGHLPPLRPKKPPTIPAASSDCDGVSLTPDPVAVHGSNYGWHQHLSGGSPTGKLHLDSSPVPSHARLATSNQPGNPPGPSTSSTPTVPTVAAVPAVPVRKPRPASAPLSEAPAAVARLPLCDRIHNTTWAVARAFGFQAFNMREPHAAASTASGSSPGPQLVASTAFLAADHLEALIVRNIMPRLVVEAQLQSGGVTSPDGNLKTSTGGTSADFSAEGSGWAPEQAPEQQEMAFARAVWELHSHMFLPYEGGGGWCQQVGVSAWPAEMALEVLSRHRATDREVVQLLLSELALYFLLYSEGANLRHTPELMWFLFWSAVHSPNMERLWREGLRPEQQPNNARQRRLAMRNLLHSHLRAAQEQLSHDPLACSPYRCAQVATELGVELSTMIPGLGLPVPAQSSCGTGSSPLTSAASAIASDLSLRCPDSRELFIDLACHGDGGFWTDVVVSPLFTVLAFEVDHMASSGQEVAHRLGYDDVNESMCRRDVVAKLLAALGVSAAAAEAGQVHGALDALTQLGYAPDISGGSEGNCSIGATAASAAPGGLRNPRIFDPVLAAAFWSDHVFIKTHRERRSWMALLRAFYRVYSLQLVMMHATMAVAFAPGSLSVLSSTVVTHAVVAALERTANWWLTRGIRDPLRAARKRESWMTAPVQQLVRGKTDEEAAVRDGVEGNTDSSTASIAASRRSRLSDGGAVEERENWRRHVAVEGAPVWGIFGWLEWVLVAAAVVALFALQHIGPSPLQKMARAYWPLVAGGYTGVVLVHGLITTRDGYSLSLSSVLRLPALFNASSQRATPSCWLHRPMAVGWRAALLTALFWVQVLAAKAAFDYFVIMKPMAGQVRYILRINWLGCPEHQHLYRLFGMQLPLRCIDGDWLLVVLRVAPFVLVCLVDTQIFYQLMLMVWGLVYGLMSLNLGIAGSWEGLLADFHRAPLRWWARCMSAEANKAALTAAAAAKRKRRDAEVGGSVSVMDATGYKGCSEDEGSEYGDLYDCSSPYAESQNLFGTFFTRDRQGDSRSDATADSSSRAHNAAPGVRRPGTSVAPSDGDDASDTSSSTSPPEGYKGGKKGKAKPRRAAAAAAELVAMLAGQGDEQLAQWMAFAAAWDAVVEDLRACDLLSNQEKSNLLFTRLPAAATSMTVAVSANTAADAISMAPGSPYGHDSAASSDHGSSQGSSFSHVGSARPLRPFLLPAFFYAGQVQRVVDTGSASPAQQLVLGELRSLLVWLGCQLRLLDGQQAAALLTASCCPATLDAAHHRSREKGLAALRSLLAAMQAMTEPLAQVSSSRDVVAQALRNSQYVEAAAALQGVLSALEVEARAVMKAQLGVSKGKAIKGGSSGAAAAQQQQGSGQVAEDVHPQTSAVALLEVVEALRGDLEERPERLAAALALLHPENGGRGEMTPASPSCTPTSNSPYSVSVDLPLMVRMLSTASKMLNLSSTAARPTGSEARRMLGFFITSLANHQLSKPCTVACMPSWTVLTPLYAEDVLFPLEAVQVAEELGLGPSRQGDATAKPCGPSPSSLLPDLLTETEERVSLMAYIRSLYPKDWDNFKERLGARLGGADLSAATECDFAKGGPLEAHALSLQLWASYRGQLLARTVRGMAAYERALRVLAALESPRPAGMSRREHAATVEDLTTGKFTHVVASQLYGHNRRSSNLRERWLAESTDVLLEAFAHLRVSYIDTVPVDNSTVAGLVALGVPEAPSTQQFAVLIRGRRSIDAASVPGDGGNGRTEEIYRVRLPHNRYSKRGVILGEGKPENQNHASIFCFGEALQTIDMNQDNALAEALKMRNLLLELAPERDTRAARKAATVLQAVIGGAASAASGPAASLPPAAEFKRLLGDLRSAERPVAVVGFREWVFSDKAGALGSFAASSEFAFSTMVQRTMAYPANVRLHYGHPDAFNKVFAMTRGGVAKATRQLHVSEDIFGGMNHSLRGGRIKFREYVSCGKGRDMGFDSINAFESKISAGFGEVALSRDLLRMATRVDLWRCLHLYHSLAGNYFNTWLVMGSVYAQVYAVLFFSLARAVVYRHITYYPSPPPPPLGTPTPPASLNTPPPPAVVRESSAYDTIRVEHMLQLGLLLLLPYMAEIALEHGLVRGLLAAVAQVLSGSVAFFIFKQQTTTTALHRSMLYGGATYIATGRGFSITSSSFIKLFANYGRSHIALGFELGAMAVAVAATLECSSCSYAGLTWGTWLAAISLVLSPCWFNPMAFSPDKVKRDMHAWAAWLRGEADRELGWTWHQWNQRQLADSRDDNSTQTDHWLNVLQNLALRAVPPALLALAAASSLNLRLDNMPSLPGPLRSVWLLSVVASVLLWVMMVAAISTARRSNEVSDQRQWRRWSFWVGTLSSLAVVVFLVGLANWYSGNGLSNLILILYVNANLLLALHRTLEHVAPRARLARQLVDGGYWLMDCCLGWVLLGLLGALSLVGIVARVQTTMLFNVTFARSVKRGNLVKTIGVVKAERKR